jgi:hypothetical protein
MTSTTLSSLAVLAAATIALCIGPVPATGASEGGVYIAGDGFSFQQAADRGLAQNPRGQRFFLLALPPETAALTAMATKSAAALRDRVIAAGGVLFVCQRDIDSGAIDPSKLVNGVVAVRGFPSPGSNAMPPGERYFPGENRDNLPTSSEGLRRLRTTCS